MLFLTATHSIGNGAEQLGASTVSVYSQQQIKDTEKGVNAFFYSSLMTLAKNLIILGTVDFSLLVPCFPLIYYAFVSSRIR